MEELRSTEALDREILEDARKKADRALRDADKAARATEEEWEKNLAEDLAALEKRHAARVVSRRSETFARLPLDKRRLRAERADRLLRTAMEKALASFPRDRLFELLVREVVERASELPDRELRVTVSGMTEQEAGSVLSRAFPPPARSFSFSSGTGAADALPSLSIEGTAAVVRVGSLASGDELLRDRRAELASALLGSEALDD